MELTARTVAPPQPAGPLQLDLILDGVQEPVRPRSRVFLEAEVLAAPAVLRCDNTKNEIQPFRDRSQFACLSARGEGAHTGR